MGNKTPRFISPIKTTQHIMKNPRGSARPVAVMTEVAWDVGSVSIET
jgi:hypothetical protein